MLNLLPDLGSDLDRGPVVDAAPDAGVRDFVLEVAHAVEVAISEPRQARRMARTTSSGKTSRRRRPPRGTFPSGGTFDIRILRAAIEREPATGRRPARS